MGATVALNVLTGVGARRNPQATWIPVFMKGVALFLLAFVLGAHIWLLWNDQWDVAWALPCHLCDAAIAASIFAMFRPTPLAFELTYFWGLGGALQGMITPAIDERFPNPIFFQFFAIHMGLVTAAVFLAFGLRMTPRRGAVLRMMLWTNAFAAVAGIVDWITGANYMFLRHPPPTGSLLDYLGAWPWYLLAGELVALVVFFVLDLPFAARRRQAARM